MIFFFPEFSPNTAVSIGFKFRPCDKNLPSNSTRAVAPPGAEHTPSFQHTCSKRVCDFPGISPGYPRFTARDYSGIHTGAKPRLIHSNRRPALKHLIRWCLQPDGAGRGQVLGLVVVVAARLGASGAQRHRELSTFTMNITFRCQ